MDRHLAHGDPFYASDGPPATEPVKVDARAPRTEAARITQDYDLFVLPVVEDDEHLVGIITVDEVMDVVEEEVSDTIYHKAGVGDIAHQKDHVWSERLTGGPIWYPVRVRIMYRMIVLVGGFIVGGVVGAYGELLEALVITAGIRIARLIALRARHNGRRLLGRR